MNILITLPKHLIESILSGQKRYEMRKCIAKYMELGTDGFFVVEKGTNKIRCWCRIDSIIGQCMSVDEAKRLSKVLCVTTEYILDYAHVGTTVYLWKIGKVVKFVGLHRESLQICKNPQQFSYCHMSYEEIIAYGEWKLIKS